MSSGGRRIETIEFGDPRRHDGVSLAPRPLLGPFAQTRWGERGLAAEMARLHALLGAVSRKSSSGHPAPSRSSPT